MVFWMCLAGLERRGIPGSLMDTEEDLRMKIKRDREARWEEVISLTSVGSE
jgi:hypothetical protein